MRLKIAAGFTVCLVALALSGPSHHQSGIEDSSSGIQRYDLGSLQVLIQNRPSASIAQPSMSILCNSALSWTTRKFLGRMYIIWMKKVVSREEGDKCRPLNTLFRVISDHSTNFGVQIWSLSLLLNVFALMAQASSPVLSFLGRSFILSGLMLMTESGQSLPH